MLQIIGITDEQTHCDACGRVELRSTVILGDDDRAEVGRYGSHCAGRELSRANGRRYTDVLGTARTVEAVRRSNVAEHYRQAIRAARNGDMLAAMRHRVQAVAAGLIRPDEKDLNERLLAWARAFRDCRTGLWGAETVKGGPVRWAVRKLIDAGWTVRGLAGVLGVAVSTVRRWLAGGVTPTVANARNLMQVLRSGRVPA